MKHRFWVRGLLFALLFPWLCSSCSLTDKVPAGEQLYTGIGTVTYTFDKPLSRVVKGILPFLVVQFAVLMLVTYVPFFTEAFL